MVKPKQVERRRHARVRFESPIGLTAGAEGLQCQLKDISEVGAAVIVNRQLGEMELLGVQAKIAYSELPQVELDAQAIVVRCDPIEDGRFEVGIFFHQMSDRSRTELMVFLEAMTNSAALNAIS